MALDIIMLRAGSGDCFVVEASTASTQVWRGLIDGGPPGTPNQALLRMFATRGAGNPVPIDLIAVTHVDNDHIGGIIDLLESSARGQPTISAAAVWHNSFEQLTTDRRLTRSSVLRQRTAEFVDRNTELFDKAATSALVASITQGMTLADLLVHLALDGNAPFGSLVRQGQVARCGLGRPTITVAAPDATDLERLRRAWEHQVNQELDAARLAMYAAANIDQSVTNLSSLVFHLEHQGRSVLFTGDARGDRIVERLGGVGLLSGGRLRVDALKLPHHGSERSCSERLFAAVEADHYLISGDGTHGNPSPETARRLCQSLRGRRVTVHLSHFIERVVRVFEAESGVRLNVAEPSDAGLVVNL